MGEHILLVDDEETFRKVLRSVFEEAGYEVSDAPDGPTAISIVRNQDISIALCDLSMPGGMGGIEVLERITQLSPQTSVILITAHGTLETAMAALRKGAYDYILKPVIFEDILLKVKRLLERKQLALENQWLRQELQQKYDFHNIIGKSKPMQEIYGLLEKVAPTDSNVLITGESGSGKELVAKAIHYNSQRKNGRFVPVECSSIPDDLLESELFGHAKGAFTSALRDKDGLFKMAEGGTLFLDEIGDLPPNLQAKLLRSIEEREIRPVGETTPISIDLRLIAATNVNILESVKQDRFRGDLFYRLNVIEINIPPLRERKDDIPLLVKHFITKHNKQLNKDIKAVDNAVMRVLLSHDWQGNVRELENVMERAMILGDGEIITLQDLPPHIIGEDITSGSPANLKEAMRVYERQHIVGTLEEASNDKKQAAKMLGIGLSSLYRKMEELDVAAEE
ncbi:sigma-54-dependent transcriptional regulator [Candidatus Poribacteria bacterium]